MDDRVDLADIAEELVAQPLALARSLHEARDVDEGELGLDDFGRAGDPRDLAQPFVRHCDLADIGLDRAKRIVRRLRCLGFGQRVEQRRLADIRQPYDPAAKAHFVMSSSPEVRPISRRREERPALQTQTPLPGWGGAFD